MPGLKSARATAADAAGAAAGMLGDAHAPLIVADYRYRATQVLRRLRQRAGGRRARCLMPQELAQAALISPDSARVATVAGACRSPASSRLARITRMQADIHSFLAGQSSSLAGLKSASILARTLADIEDHLDRDDPFAGIDSSGAYAAELEFLGLLWQDKASASQRLRRQRLLAMADGASQPLAFICFHSPAPLFREVLERWRQPASLIEIELDGNAGLLDRLWQQQPEGGRTQAPVAKKMEVCSAETVEDAARTAFARISQWLERGIEKVGIVAYDRALARRVNSACNAAGIYLEDKTGWAADSLLVGSCLLAAAQLAAGGGSRSIDNLVQSLCVRLGADGRPWAREVRSWQRDQAGVLARLAGDLEGRRLPAEPSPWLQQIARMATRGPLERFFANDNAAIELIGFLHRLATEFEDFVGSLSCVEMLGLLRESLARLHVPAAPANCPLHIIPPSRVVDEPFDALLLLGANASNLPGIPEHFAFNETVRRQLGLPTREDIITETRRSTAALLAAHADRECLAVSAGFSPSPYLELLAPAENIIQPLPPAWQHPGAGADAACGRSASIPRNLRPQRLSPSGADTIMACPYKFFVDNLLQASEEESASLFDPARFGQLVHEIVKIHHDGSRDGQDPESLERTSARVLADAKMDESERRLISWRLQPLLERYAEFTAMRRDQGWQPVAAEKEMAVQLDPDLSIELAGRLDLIEENGSGQQAVCDIKTGTIARSEVIKGEKPQLLLYAHMAGSDPLLSFLRIVRIEAGRARVEDVTMARADPELAGRMFSRLQQQARQMFAESLPLPANGADRTCRSCAAAGMCRRPHWGQPH